MTGISNETEILNQRKLDISSEIKDKVDIKNQIVKHITEPQEGVNIQTLCMEVEMNNFPGKNILFVKERVDLEELGMSVGKLYEMAAINKLTVLGSHYVRYDDIFDEDGEFKMQTCLPVTEIFGNESSRVEDNYKCIHVRYKGGFSTVGRAHQFMKKYSESNAITLVGTAFEIYNKDMTVDVYYRVLE